MKKIILLFSLFCSISFAHCGGCGVENEKSDHSHEESKDKECKKGEDCKKTCDHEKKENKEKEE